MTALLRTLGICLLFATPLLAVAQDIAMLREGHLNFREIQAFITAEHITTLDELIRRLPESTRTSYSLMYSSESNQGSSTDEPRIILRDVASGSFMAFTGSHNGANSNTFEIIERNPATGENEANLIEFSSNPSTAPHFVSNPQECYSCHGDPIHPNWHSYPFWPGSIGSDDDNIFPGSAEEGYLRGFMTHAASSSRYRWLRPALSPTEVATLAAGNPVQRATRPNEHLGEEIARVVAQQLYHDLVNSPRYSECQDLMRYWALDCAVPWTDPMTHIGAFFPPETSALSRIHAWDRRINRGIAFNNIDFLIPGMTRGLRGWERSTPDTSTPQTHTPRYYRTIGEERSIRLGGFDHEATLGDIYHYQRDISAAEQSYIRSHAIGNGFFGAALETCGLDLMNYSPTRSLGVLNLHTGNARSIRHTLRALLLDGVVPDASAYDTTYPDYSSRQTECISLESRAWASRAQRAPFPVCFQEQNFDVFSHSSLLREIIDHLPHY